MKQVSMIVSTLAEEPCLLTEELGNSWGVILLCEQSIKAAYFL